jgi:hypothetical protein
MPNRTRSAPHDGRDRGNRSHSSLRKAWKLPSLITSLPHIPCRRRMRETDSSSQVAICRGGRRAHRAPGRIRRLPLRCQFPTSASSRATDAAFEDPIPAATDHPAESSSRVRPPNYGARPSHTRESGGTAGRVMPNHTVETSVDADLYHAWDGLHWVTLDRCRRFTARVRIGSSSTLRTAASHRMFTSNAKRIGQSFGCRR